MLEVKNLSKNFKCSSKCGRKTVTAVNDVSFSVANGEFCALVGESGSGKTTLSRLIMGLIPPNSGDILLDGKSIVPSGKKRSKALCQKLQMVLQDSKSALDPRYTVYESIAEPIQNLTDLTKAEERLRVRTLAMRMHLSENLLDRKANEISGGQQRRVCIARALASDPEIVIFDEAVSGIDALVRKEILDLLKQLHHEQKTTFIIITHDMEVALYLADRVLVMKDGDLVEQVAFNGNTFCFSHPYSLLLIQEMKAETQNA